jgi:hypothetical protein
MRGNRFSVGGHTASWLQGPRAWVLGTTFTQTDQFSATLH